MGCHTVTSITAYRHENGTAADDVDDRSNTQAVLGPSRPPFGATITAVGPFEVLQRTDAKIDQLSQEIRLATDDLRYEQPVSDSFAGYLDVNARWQSRFNFDAGGERGNPNLFQNGYAIVDARIGVLSRASEGTRFELSLDVNNVFDQSYASSIFQDFVVLDSLNVVNRVPKAADRFFGATLRIKR